MDFYRIFIVEDDTAMAKTMANQLTSWGNQVHMVSDFQNVVAEFEAYNPHLVLLDVMLPFYNGYHWCSEIRKRSNVPVVFLSSASDNMNIVMAMNMGGDDFIAKPVDLDVMMAKLQAVLRRAYDMSGDVPILEHRGAVLNLNDTTLDYRGARMELTKNEYRILQTLLENKGKIVSRDTLMTRLWQMDSYVEENTLTVNVNRLRKKLEQAGLNDFITTKVGSGYIIV
jgi:DNA-binding response OmpR family regulator